MEKERVWYLVGKKLAHEATGKELEELEELLRRDPEAHYAIQHLTDIWQLPVRETPGMTSDAFQRHMDRLQAADQPEAPVIEAAFPGIIEEETAPVPGHRKPWYIITMVVAAALVGIIFYVNERSQSPAHGVIAAQKKTEQNEIVTRYGNRTRVSLPDGTQVWLNAGSRLRYDKQFGTGNRNVELSGEAYFDVAQNPQLPFLIHTHQVEVKVLGTAFDIKSYPGDRQTETSLISGKVQISIKNRPEEKYILKPHEKLVVLNDDVVKESGDRQSPEPMISLSRLTYQAKDSTILETAWVNNKLVFDNEPFVDIAKKMERWYGVSFRFRNTAKEQIRLTGSFEKETLEEALNALKVIASFDYKVSDQGIVTIQ